VRRTIRSNGRQIDSEAGAFSGLRNNTDCARVTFNNAVADRQSQTGALCAFRREERLEYFLLHVVRHSHAVIREVQLQSILDAATADHEPSAPRHGVNGIYDHVDKDFTQL
jgi:DNA integrity scanning protein DisA with diadenylate cyclase activity